MIEVGGFAAFTMSFWLSYERRESRLGIAMKPGSQMKENYGRFEADDRSWDVAFWQQQGSEAIFAAVWDMILFHRLLKTGDATEPRLQRSVERFGKA